MSEFIAWGFFYSGIVTWVVASCCVGLGIALAICKVGAWADGQFDNQ